MTDFFREMMREMVLEMASDQGLLMFIALVIAAPILEELIFRGIMLDGLLRIYSPTKAVIVSSLLFGLIHLNPATVCWRRPRGWLYGLGLCPYPKCYGHHSHPCRVQPYSVH